MCIDVNFCKPHCCQALCRHSLHVVVSDCANASCRVAPHAGASLHQHLSQLMPPLLTLASRIPRNIAAAGALRSIVLSVQEDGAYLLIAELTKVQTPCSCRTSFLYPIRHLLWTRLRLKRIE